MSDVRTSAELTQATATGLRWISLARVGVELLLLASLVVLARLIPPSAFGMFAVAIIVQELAITVPSEGVGTALVQRKSITREHLQGGFALALLMGAGLTAATLLLVVAVIEPVFGGETASLVVLATPWFLVAATTAPSFALIRRRLEFRRLSILELTNSIVRTVITVVLAVLGLDASALVLGGLAGLIVMTVLALVLAPVPRPRWRSREMRDLLSYGGPASLACLCWAGFRNGDYAIVGARLGVAQAGYYWRGFQLAVEYQRKISAVMTSVAVPVMARTANADEMFALRRRMVRLLTVALFPLLTSLVVIAPVVIPWLFGPAWEPAVLPTQILAAAGASTVIIDAVGTVLMAAGRARAMLGYGVAHFVVYIGAVLVASRWGLAGVSIAAATVHLVFVVVAYQVLVRDRPERALPLLWNDISAATVSCAALVAAALPLDLALRGSDLPTIVYVAVVGAAGAGAYAAALRVLFPRAWRDVAAVLRRVVPVPRIRTAVRRLPLLAGRS